MTRGEAALDHALDAWVAEEDQREDENREEAARRIRIWLADGHLDMPLDLANLSLTSVPEILPAELQTLDAAYNRLTNLPENLPAGLQTLLTHFNLLSSLPEVLPAGLRILDIGHNLLTSLPEALPVGLQTLDVSVNRLTRLPESLPADLRALDVYHNHLTSLPATLPTNLDRLIADHNQLTSLPEALPTRLDALYASHNLLTSLPEALPVGLQTLDISANRLTSLPESLPADLQTLNTSYNRLTRLPVTLPIHLDQLIADHNELTSLPEALPVGLQALDVGNNRLTSLPETLLTRWGFGCTIHLEANPLSERVHANLSAALTVSGYAGPQVFFSMASGAEEDQARSLPEAVVDWFGAEEDQQALVEMWHSFAEEEGAQQYARFLDRLRDTVSYGDAAFMQAVADDLRQAAARPRLRQLYFQLAFGASETCEDRITLTWIGMQTARLNADVENGAYDERLDELVRQARVLFRLDALERIARQKVRSLRFVDEIEVYLAYQVKLRNNLELALTAPDMRFFAASYVTEDDLTAAEHRVRAEEEVEFAGYLATRWQPWETVVSRIEPVAYTAMQERLLEAMGGEFQSRLQRRLARAGLTGDADAERELGFSIRNEIACEIKGDLMHQVLRNRGIDLCSSSD
ncbi:NEL-type E3 ubiquitin ligase domain-containing protein [Neorhizobium huautlense]|uniref:NEL-type E3 ubiquitin ligase domain-containing protein n=1 Tax=Neorhizobium huautlense TaxID=67774 RepID=UPI001FDFD42D|nr:NEL-type E3 ubiquitin ligase domain-containing protein [Neorhizobium huautlense]